MHSSKQSETMQQSTLPQRSSLRSAREQALVFSGEKPSHVIHKLAKPKARAQRHLLRFVTQFLPKGVTGNYTYFTQVKH